MTSYSERAYFDNDACAHCATRDEYIRLRWIETRNRAITRNRINRDCANYQRVYMHARAIATICDDDDNRIHNHVAFRRNVHDIYVQLIA